MAVPFSCAVSDFGQAPGWLRSTADFSLGEFVSLKYTSQTEQESIYLKEISWHVTKDDRKKVSWWYFSCILVSLSCKKTPTDWIHYRENGNLFYMYMYMEIWFTVLKEYIPSKVWQAYLLYVWVFYLLQKSRTFEICITLCWWGLFLLLAYERSTKREKTGIKMPVLQAIFRMTL